MTTGLVERIFQALLSTLMVVFIAIGTACIDTYAQERNISLDVKEVSLSDVLESIKQQTHCTFSYNVELESSLEAKKVSIKIERATLEQVLDELFKNTSIDYKIIGNSVLLSKKNGQDKSQAMKPTITQTVKGKVVDKESKTPVAGVNVVLLNSPVVLGTTTDINGMFSFKVPLGKQNLKFSFIGYEEFIASNLDVVSGKEIFVNVEMRESLVKLNEVVVSSSKLTDQPANSMAVISARQLTAEDASRYAGGFYDPARMVNGFAGVVGGEDGRNNIIVRGNSPMGLQWKLDGVEIPNPSHFSNGQGDTGGIFSIVSTDALTNSDFFTGAFPAEYGNATSGVLDLMLRDGNADRREYGVQISMIGGQVSMEGPLRKDGRSSYMINYRYGNLQLLNELGLIDLEPNQKPIVFQDVNFNFKFATRRAGTFSIFGIGGVSTEGTFASKDSTTWRHSSDMREDDNQKHRMGVGGVMHTLTLPNNKTYLKTVLAGMYQYDQTQSGRLNDDYSHTMNDSGRYSYPTVRIASTLNHKFNAKHTIRAGATYSQLFFDLYAMAREQSESRVYTDYSGGSSLAQAFLQWKYRLNDDVELNMGLHNMFFLLNHDYSLEPRLGMKWQMSPRSSLSYGFGLHSKIAPISVYFSQIPNEDGIITTPNKKLEASRAMHNIIGYDLSILHDLRVKIEAYYQYLYNVPVTVGSNSTYSILNSQYNVPDSALYNQGQGYNKGIELSIEKFYSNNYYFLVSGSVFDSKFKAGNGEIYDTYFNTNFQTNWLLGRDFKVGRNDQNVVSVNFRALVHGGFRYTPMTIDEDPNGIPRYYPIVSETYTKQMPTYFRLDMGVKYRRNNPRYSWILSLDVQNVTNRENVVGYEQFVDFRTNTFLLVPEAGLGIIPVLNFKIEF